MDPSRAIQHEISSLKGAVGAGSGHSVTSGGVQLLKGAIGVCSSEAARLAGLRRRSLPAYCWLLLLPVLREPLWSPCCAPPAALAPVLTTWNLAAMVAGMLMPLDQLRAIYEVLFREGVMVAKKDRRPRSLHPHVPGVTNLQVMRAMASLRARGLVRETFAWRHFYWYLTNEGIAHLRQYLHLPPEIVPASLQRVRRPVALVMPARRTPHVQTVQGPLGCPPKRGPLLAEDPAREERQIYRRKEPEEGTLETPVVPASTPGTLATPIPEPAPTTGLPRGLLSLSLMKIVPVVGGHIITLAAVWHWRRGRQRVQDKQDERDRVQKKTFTKWVNKHLIKAQRHISDLYEDLRDGHNLISLLEVLSGDSLPREKGRMRFHKLQNVQIALDYLRHRQVKLVNIRNDDIADGNPKLTLGLIWTIILHFQISDIQVSGQSEDMTAKEKLLLWSQRMVEGYQGLRCDNFTSSWRDGRLFNAIIHRHKPMLIDMSKVYRQTNLENLDQAFSVAERDLGVTRLLDPEDVDVPQPDEKSIITYVSSLYDAMPRVPGAQDGVRANELQLRWQEYRELVLLLLQWIRHHTTAFEERKFPSSFEEIEILWCQFLKFKETELPAKEADKNRSKGIYQSLEGAVQAGQLKVPPGYHPLDVEKEWGKLHVAILEREKQLRSEFERLECLQRIVSKLQMEAGLCEEQLNQADTLLQSDVRLLASGKTPQRAGEVERDLDKADGMIRLLFNDVQTLKDGRHPQGEQMYRRVYRLHERLVAIRTEYNLRLKAGVAAPVTQVTLQSTQRRPELEDSTLRYLQDLLAWVEENQRRVDSAEWGVDLPSVEAQLGSHRGLHQSIEEFRAKIERARSDEGQLSPATRGAYRDCLGRLDLQYAKLLNSSKARLRSLESLHGFVAAATKELMWLNEKEEEEVGFDWSDRNTNMVAKKESYSALMRELELKEKKIKEIQNTGDRLLREDHPARPTVESFQAALQTQWSWMLQLCCCIEAHLKENTAYFQFFSDVREAEEQLQKLQETLRRKYSCDRSITITRLEDLLQDAQDEKEQLNEYKGHLSGLAKRAKAIVQLKPRNPGYPVRGHVPLLAVCDYKQVEVTMHKGDQCQLVGPAQPSHWKVLSSSGSEAAVPSVCFLVPPPNQEALEAITRLEAQHQALVALWHQLHVDMKSLLAWQSLSRDVQLIRSWSLVTFRTLKPEEQRQALRSLELHYQAFLRDSQDAGGFGPEDRLAAEREYSSCSHHYQQLLQNLEQGEQEESRCQRCISELKDIRLQLEAYKEPLKECAQRIAEQQAGAILIPISPQSSLQGFSVLAVVKAQAEIDGLGKGVARLSAEAEKVLALPEPSSGVPILRSELELTLGKLEQVRSLSAIYLEKLKTISLVIRSTQGAEDMLRAHEEQLKEVQAVPATLPELESTKASLKKLRAQAEAQQPVFDALKDELRGAQEVGERLQQRHGERDVEVERWRERVTQLLERWQAVLAQTDVRQRELEQLGRQLRYYRESTDPLNAWLQDARCRQEQIQAVPMANSRAVREQLQQEKALLEEIERHGEKVEECQKFAKQYINAIKDYELHLVTYKAQLEPVASPAKKPKVQSGSESVIQEYVDLRTRYSELTTLTSQYIKFISETLRRMEEEEEQRRMQEEVARREEAAVDAQQQKRSIQEELQHLRQSSEAEIQAKTQQVEAAERSRLRIEEEIRVVRLQLETTERQRGGAEGELQALRARAEEAEAQRRQAQEEAERLRKQVQEESQRKRQAEAELALRVKAEAEAAREKQRALQSLEELRLQAEEAERRLRQAEAERARQVQVARETAQRSAEAELQSKRASFAEKTAQLERTLQEEHVTVTQLREEAERRAQQQAEAERAREEAERELERWQLKANEALRLRLQAEEVAQQKSLAQAEAEKQKEEAEREARRRGKAEEQAVRQREQAEQELEKQRQLAEGTAQQRLAAEQELIRLRAETEQGEQQRQLLEEELSRLQREAAEATQKRRELEAELAKAQEEAERLRKQVQEESQRKRQAEAELALRVKAEAEAAREKQRALQSLEELRLQAEEAERRLRQAEAERARQVQVARETAQRSAEAELQSKRASFAEKTAQLERTLQEEHVTVTQLREEAERRAQQQAEAERAREEAERELERWQLKANEALRLRLQAEEVAQQKSLAQAEAEKQKEEAEREARRRGKAEEQAVRQREQAEQELEKQRQLAEGTAQQRLAAEQELIRLRAETEQGEQQRQLLEEELSRLQREAAEATQKRRELEAELAKVRAEMEVLLASKARAEEESRSTSEKSKQRLEAEASRFRELAEEAARLRALAEEAKRQRQLAEEDAERQRAEAERVLTEKLAAISEATRLKTEAEIVLKEKEAENERLRRLAEDEAFQRRKLEEQAAQHKADIEERLAQLRKASESELERQKGLVEDTLRQRRQVEEEILALKASFEKAAAGKAELELELGRIRSNAEDTLRSKEQAELEAARQRQLAAEEEQRRREAEERVQKSLAAEEEAARQRKAALEEVERLKAKVEEARRLRERAEQESTRQLQLAQEAAQKRLQAEEKAHAFVVQQREQELQQTLQQEQSMLERLRGEAEAARRAAEEAEEAREHAEREVAQSRRQVEEAERLKQLAEEQAQAQAQAQAAAEKLRKEAEQEAARRAQAEQAALKQKLTADAEIEKHKKFSEQTLRQKAQVEQELTTLRLQLEETDHQKGILDEELQRLKAEVTEAARQRSQVEEELFSVRVQMEELSKLKARIEAENRALILRDKDNTQRFLEEEAEKMKQVAEEAARLSVAAQEAARLRQLAEEDLAQQRALAEKMLKEKMQAVQEATRLKAEAELLQQQKELAQEQARQLQEDKKQMAQQLEQETQGFQRTLEAERQRQLEMSAEAERLKLRMVEMSRAQARAEEDAQRFRKQAEEIGEKLHRTELATQEKVTLVQTLEIQRQQSDQDAERLREAIAELEREKEKLKQEAKLLQLKSEEMQTVQQVQMLQETQALQQSFLSEKDSLLQREHFIEQEKAKLEQLFQDEVAKAQQLREEQRRQQEQMEQEKQQLVASMEEARRRQHEAEEGVRRKQEELQRLEQQRQQQEKLLAEENQRLRERLQRLEEEHRAALAHSEEIAALQAAAVKALPNGRDTPDGPAVEVEPEDTFQGLRQRVPAQQLQEAGILSTEELQWLAQGHTTVAELARREDVHRYLQGRSSIAGLLLKPTNEKLSIYTALQRQLLSPGTALILLEAQAASGFLLDPVRNRRLTVNEAVKEGVVGPELHHKLLSAERAVTGYKDPYTGEQISLFQAMQKDLIVHDHGIRLLEAQIATGGIIDPVHSHRLPVDMAYQRGYFDEAMSRVLADPSDDTKGFFDPNTHENLTYLQLLERCVEDPETGLCLLPLTDKAAKGGELVYTDSEARDVFEKATVSAPFGKFQGKTVTIWEIINSEYFTAEQRRDLLRQFRTGRITVEKIIKIVITVVEEHERKGQLCFEGLRALVPATELLESRVINHDLYQQLQQGKRSVREVAEMDAVRQALRGASVIAGVWLEEARQKLSIYEALRKGLLQPDVAVALLEAQAGTGHIIDPATSARLTVDEAVRAGLVGPELHEKLLSAEKAVTGYRDPYSGKSVSLFQALKKGLIPREQGLRLLDAQLSTGGIVDPSKSHRVPLDVACARGYLDEETNRALLTPRDDAKVYLDPSTCEPVTYSQLQQRCQPDQLTGLSLLLLSEKAIQARQEEVYSELQARETFEKATVEVPMGSFKGRMVTVWELISSEYFTEEQRRELLRQFRTGKVTVEKVIKILITIVEEVETKRQERLSFSGLRAPVPASELLAAKVLSRAQFEQLKDGKTSVKDLSELQQGKRSVREVAEMDAVRQALRGASVIAGVWLEEARQKLSIYEALRKGLLQPDVAVALLEAQAGTGHIIDPATSARLTVDEAVRAGLVGPELHEKLLSAEKAVTGYRDPYSGKSVSLFQALKKGLIPREQGLRLLDAQLSTGGIVDPSKSHRVPLDVACARGYLDEETNRALLTPRDDAKVYLDPSTCEPVTYSQLQQRCQPDQLTGLSLLLLSEKAIQARQEEVYSELQARETFEKATVEVPMGSFKGRMVTVWELISSEYFTEEQRRELLRQFRTGKVTVEKVIKILITIVEEVETKRQERLSFSGLRAPVPASELLAAKVLSRAQFEQLKDGKTSVKDLSEVGSVRTLLQGSGCLAGIYLEDSKEKVTIYEAMRRGLLRPSTATLLLEAQAATGFLVDPVRNQRLYVHEAVKAGVVGPELHEKLLSAEKAVTGYKDPYSGTIISLFQAMKKGLVLREHGIRLLEAQIATGGIIDPVHSHRLPVEVAYQRGYFDEEMSRILADPSDDTKGFFDPNTHENLTYLQLLERCVEDPETGLRLLPLKGAEKAEVVETTQLLERCVEDPETGLRLLPLKGAEKAEVVETTQVYTEEETRRAFEETQIDIPGGGSHGGSTMSLWEVMQSDLIPEEQRSRLMADFQAGRVTKERMIIIIIEIIEKTEIIRQQNLTSYDYVRRRLTAEDLYEARIISLESYNLLREGSKSLREVLEAESVWRYLYGTGSVAGVYVPGSRQTLTVYQALKKGLLSAEVARLLLEAQAATGFLLDPVKGERLTVDEAVRKGLVGPELHDRLLSAERAVTGYRDPYTEQTISLFQAMKKELIPAEEALRLLDAQLATGGIVDPRLGFHLPLEVAYQRGYLNKDTYDQLSEPSEVRSYMDPSTDERLSYTQLLRRCRRDDNSGQMLLPLSDTRKLTFRGLRKQITVEELVRSQVMDEATALQLQEGLTSIEEVTKNLQKFLEGTSCIAGVFVDATKERLSVYQAMKKGIIRPGTAFELLEAQAATGYVIDPIKGLKLTVEEAVRMGIVGPEFKDKLLSAERAVTGYKDPYTGKLISLFQAMKKGLILKDHGIRLLEAQIATGGIIDPEESHRLPVEVAYKRGLFDEEMNEILVDPSDDTKGFFDPNTEENLTYLQLMERCITDPQTGLCLLPLKEKKRERKTSSKSSVRKRRVVIVDPETGKEMSVYEAYRKGLIDHQTYLELSEQECEWEEITISSSDGVVKSMIIDRRSGRQYDIDDAISKNFIDRSALDQYRAGTLSITEFADMLSGNASGFRSRLGSSSSYPISPVVSRTQLTSWSDPTEETGPVAGILDTETLEKVSITEAMHRNLVDNITGQRLLEAQACTGGIIDPSTGERFPVTDAVNKGLVDKIMVDRINLAQKAFSGFEDPRTKTKMSAAQALKKGWLYYEAGQRFLEVQYLTGGLIEPDVPGRVSLDEALHRGTVDTRTAQKLRDVSAYSKYLTCPKTKLKISYKDALDRSMVEEGTGLRLLEAAAQSSKGYYSPYSVSGSGSTAGSRTGSRTGSRPAVAVLMPLALASP
ncbi:Plectin-1 [Heterocephalus glaber]|uniref:Plectin n=2 Tax=Boreoeutheria TaxID=1437010 RepID=G5C5U7_HETGA|nr:Plectin-1 [Heterocephalus glaber]